MDDTTEPPSEHTSTSTPQTSPMDPQPFGPRERQPYRVVPRPPTPPPPRDDDLPLQASHYLTLEEEMRMRMGRFRERNGRVNDSPSTFQHDSGYRNRAATGPGTSENTFRGGNDAQNQPQDSRHGPQASGSEPQWLMGLSRPAGIALGLVSWSAIIGGLGALGWMFWHSQVGREIFAEVVAGSEALMVVGRGLMGIGTAMARGVWAVMKHYGRNPGRYVVFLYGVYQVVGAFARGAWFQARYGVRVRCYCYACRVEMAQAIRRETGVSPAELHVDTST